MQGSSAVFQTQKWQLCVFTFIPVLCQHLFPDGTAQTAEAHVWTHKTDRHNRDAGKSFQCRLVQWVIISSSKFDPDSQLLVFQQLCLVLTLCAVFWVSRRCRIWNYFHPFLQVLWLKWVFSFIFSGAKKAWLSSSVFCSFWLWPGKCDWNPFSWHLSDCPYRMLTCLSLTSTS